MRLSSFLLPVALLLCISSVSAEDIVSGTWSSPYAYKNVSQYCCIPTSIKIDCVGSSSCSATYNFPSVINSQCWNLFLSSTPKLSLYKSGSTYSTEDYYSETTFFGKMKFNFMFSNTTGIPRLNINSASSSYSDGCDFNMLARSVVNPTPSGGPGGLVILIIIFFVIAACGGAKKYQSRQANVIIAQNLTQQPTVVTTFNHQPNAVIQVNQGFVQPQPTYIAPNQFPNGQVNVNFGANNGQRF